MNIFLNIMIVLTAMFLLLRFYIIFGVARNHHTYNYNIKDSGRNNTEIGRRMISLLVAFIVMGVLVYFRFYFNV